MIQLLVGKGEHPGYLPLFASVGALMVLSVGVLMLTVNEKRVKARLEAECRAVGEAFGGEEEKEDDSEKKAASKQEVYGLQCGDDGLFQIHQGGLEVRGRRFCGLSDGGYGCGDRQLHSDRKHCR